jgi:hypothetical protein
VTEPKPRVGRPLGDTIDRTAPASIVIQKFGGLTAFCKATGIPLSTAHDWEKKGLIPSTQFSHVLVCSADVGAGIEPTDFVPVPAAAA